MRVTNAVKAKYTRLKPESEACFYCGNHSSLDDLTPHPKASEADRELFREEFTITRVCKSCWSRIYTANVQNGGIKFNVALGCMTVEQKRLHINKVPVAMNQGAFVKTHDGSYVVPAQALKMEDGSWLVGEHKIFDEEMRALQGVFVLKMHAMDEEFIEETFQGALAKGAIEISREGLFRNILQLEWPE